MAWVLAAIAILAIGGLVALSLKPPPKTPQIHSDQKPDSAAKSQHQRDNHETSSDQKPTVEQQDAAENSKRETDRDAEKRAEEAREYWPFHILGARLKITDSLLALFTLFLIVVGAVQGVFLYRTDQGTHKAADAAKESAEIARDTLLSTQRPWMWFDVGIRGNLKFDNGAAIFPITLSGENVGNTPALRVDFFPPKIFQHDFGELKSVPPDQFEIIRQSTDLPEELKKYCQGALKGSEGMEKFGHLRGNAVFPSKQKTVNYDVTISREEVQDAVAKSRDKKSWGPLILLTCVTYRFPNDTKSRYTGRAFMVAAIHPSGALAMINPATSNDVPIRLEEFMSVDDAT